MNQKLKRICGLMCAVLAAVLLPVLPSAAEPDGGETLTVQYAQEGVRFDLYRAAEFGSDGQWSLTGVFADYPVEITGSGWLDTAATLAGFAAADHLPADASAVTAGGSVTFTGLERGLYLVVGQPSEAGGFRYTPVPSLVWVSSTVNAIVKYDQEELPVEQTSLTVQKVWADDTSDTRPDSVSIRLLCDGAVYSTATLTASNGWHYTWDGLAAGHNWQVAEASVPDGYTVSVSRSGDVFTVTNRGTAPPPATTTEPEEFPPDHGDEPETGDATRYGLVAGIAAAAAGTAAVLMLLRRKTHPAG